MTTHTVHVLARYTALAGDLVQFPHKQRPADAPKRANADLDRDPEVHRIIQKYAHRLAKEMQYGGGQPGTSFDRHIGKKLDEWGFAAEFDDSVGPGGVFHVAREIIRLLAPYRARYTATGRTIRAVVRLAMAISHSECLEIAELMADEDLQDKEVDAAIRMFGRGPMALTDETIETAIEVVTDYWAFWRNEPDPGEFGYADQGKRLLRTLHALQQSRNN